MSYVETLHTEHLARLSRLNGRAPEAGPIIRKTPPKVIPILNGKQFHWKPKPVGRPARDWLIVATGQFKALQTEVLGPSNRPPVRGIATIVAKHFGFTLSELISARRTRKIVIPRQIAMYLAKALTLDSFPQIGRMLGKDHTTALYGFRKIEWLRSTDAALDAEILLIQEKIAKEYPEARA